MTRARCALVIAMTLIAGASGCARDNDEAHSDRDADELHGPAPTSTAARPEGEAPKPVTLDTAEQTRLGVVVAKLVATAAPSGTPTTARVLDPGPLLALDSELAAATASMNASRAEAERTRKLFAEDRTASARALEMANSQAQADRQRVESAQRRIWLEWGEGVARLSPGKRASLLEDLSQLRAELVRVELPPDIAPPPSGSMLAIQVNADGPELKALVLGTLSEADPRLQTRALLVELRGTAASLGIGSMLLARIPGREALTGVLLPRGALIRKDSRVWAYVQTAPTTFERREVSEYQALPEGWLVRSGFAPGERLVTAGAASLFAIEAPAAAAD